MRKLALTLVLLLGLVAPAGAADAGRPTRGNDVAGTAAAIKVLERKRDGARVVSWTVSTPSLEMSSSTPLHVHVILPSGYRKHPLRRYPVLYALPGTSNQASVWLTNIHTVDMTRKLNLIVVVPDGTYDADGGGFYTNWVDQTTSRGVADWETFHTQPVLQGVAEAAGVRFGWHSYTVGTHAWQYGDRSLKDYLPRLMRYFRGAA